MSEEKSKDKVDLLSGLEEDFLDRGQHSTWNRNHKDGYLLPFRPKMAIIGAGLCIFIILFAIFILRSGDSGIDKRAWSIEVRLEQLEDRVLRLEGMFEANSVGVPEFGKTKTRFHVIQPGDTLNSISRLYGLTIEELRRMNNLQEGAVIYAGEKLIVGTETSGR